MFPPGFFIFAIGIPQLPIYEKETHKADSHPYNFTDADLLMIQQDAYKQQRSRKEVTLYNRSRADWPAILNTHK